MNKRESTISKTPPSPGSVLLSLTTASRLSSDSARSPICPKTPMSIPSQIDSVKDKLNWPSKNCFPARWIKKLAMTAEINPATAPSTVFFGLKVRTKLSFSPQSADKISADIGDFSHKDQIDKPPAPFLWNSMVRDGIKDS